MTRLLIVLSDFVSHCRHLPPPIPQNVKLTQVRRHLAPCYWASVMIRKLNLILSKLILIQQYFMHATWEGVIPGLKSPGILIHDCTFMTSNRYTERGSARYPYLITLVQWWHSVYMYYDNGRSLSYNIMTDLMLGNFNTV